MLQGYESSLAWVVERTPDMLNNAGQQNCVQNIGGTTYQTWEYFHDMTLKVSKQARSTFQHQANIGDYDLRTLTTTSDTVTSVSDSESSHSSKKKSFTGA